MVERGDRQDPKSTWGAGTPKSSGKAHQAQITERCSVEFLPQIPAIGDEGAPEFKSIPKARGNQIMGLVFKGPQRNWKSTWALLISRMGMGDPEAVSGQRRQNIDWLVGRAPWREAEMAPWWLGVRLQAQE